MGKSKKKAARLCSTCGYRHTTPTGKNCVMEQNKSEDLPVDSSQHNEDDHSSDSEQEVAAALHNQQVREAEFHDEFSSRLDRLEKLFMKSLEKDNGDSKPDKKSSVAQESDFDSDDSLYSAESEERRQRRKVRKAR